MPMTTGSVTVGSDGSVTKSGGAEVVYDKMVTDYEANVDTIPSGADGVAHKQSFADIANGVAALVGYMKDNAEGVIGTSDGGLQTDADTGNPTDPPATEQTISIR